MSTITASQLTNSDISPATQLNSFASHARKVEAAAVATLESHPHFRGRCHRVTVNYVNRCLRLSGKVPSYYLKQLAQEAVRGVAGVERVENRIAVVGPFGEVEFGGEPFGIVKPRIQATTSNRKPR